MNTSTLIGRCRRVVGTGTQRYPGLSLEFHLLDDVRERFGGDQVNDPAALAGKLDLLIAIAFA